MLILLHGVRNLDNSEWARVNKHYYFWVLSHTKLINKGSSVFKQYYPKLYFKNRVITIF